MTLYPKPEQVTTAKCPKGDEPGHVCVHDWRVFWGNVPREVSGEGG